MSRHRHLNVAIFRLWRGRRMRGTGGRGGLGAVEAGGGPAGSRLARGCGLRRAGMNAAHGGSATRLWRLGASRCGGWRGFCRGDGGCAGGGGKRAGLPGGEHCVQGFGEALELQPEQNHRRPVAERSPGQGDFKLREDACPMVHGRSYMTQLDVMQGKNAKLRDFFLKKRRLPPGWFVASVVRHRASPRHGQAAQVASDP